LSKETACLNSLTKNTTSELNWQKRPPLWWRQCPQPTRGTCRRREWRQGPATAPGGGTLLRSRCYVLEEISSANSLLLTLTKETALIPRRLETNCTDFYVTLLIVMIPAGESLQRFYQWMHCSVQKLD
jgi:hypothetical protein